MTNTTDKYITIPAEQLSSRERRAHPNGKQVPNPDYQEPKAEREAREHLEALLAIPGARLWTQKGQKRVYFNETFISGKYDFFNGYYDCTNGEWTVTGKMGDEANATKLHDFRARYGV